MKLIYIKKRYLLIIITIITICIILLLLVLLHKKPIISHISSNIVRTGMQIDIYGKHFDVENTNAYLLINNKRVIRRHYKQWTPTHIVLHISDTIASGYLSVYTQAGQSNSILIVNTERLPKKSTRTALNATPLLHTTAGAMLYIPLQLPHYTFQQQGSAQIFITNLQKNIIQLPENFITLINNKALALYIPYYSARGSIQIQFTNNKKPLSYQLDIRPPSAGKWISNNKRTTVIQFVLDTTMKNLIALKDIHLKFTLLPTTLYQYVEIPHIDHNNPLVWTYSNNKTFNIVISHKTKKLYNKNIITLYSFQTALSITDINSFASHYSDTDIQYYAQYQDETPWYPYETQKESLHEIMQTIDISTRNIYEQAQHIYQQLYKQYQTYNDTQLPSAIPLTIDEKNIPQSMFSRIVTSLFRMNGIKARTVYGINVATVNQKTNTYPLLFWTEFLLPEFGWVTLSSDTSDMQYEIGTKSNSWIMCSELSDTDTIQQYRNSRIATKKNTVISVPQCLVAYNVPSFLHIQETITSSSNESNTW